MLTGSTNSRTPFDSYTWSPAPPPSSIISPYWKPEHPPPCTNTRRPLPAFPSSAISSLIFVAAVGDTLIIDISPLAGSGRRTTNQHYSVRQSGPASTTDPTDRPILLSGHYLPMARHRSLLTNGGQLAGRLLLDVLVQAV